MNLQKKYFFSIFFTIFTRKREKVTHRFWEQSLRGGLFWPFGFCAFSKAQKRPEGAKMAKKGRKIAQKGRFFIFFEKKNPRNLRYKYHFWRFSNSLKGH
jgi:hypothetical protein